MTKFIFTADDYGIVDAVDQGVRNAVENGWLNSVEVFPNDVDRVKSSVEKLANTNTDKLAQNQGGNFVNVGAHLTITSGKPLTGSTLLTQRSGPWFGYFHDWVELKRPEKNKRIDEVRQLKAELRAQIELLKSVCDQYNTVEFNHLTCHHNSVYFFDEFTEVFFDLAKEYNLAVRSPHGMPKGKDNLFYLQLIARLRDSDLNFKDRNEIWTMHKNMEEYLAKAVNKPRMTTYHNNVNYGPPPFIKINERKMKRKANRKFKKLSSWIKDHREEGHDSVEFVLHLIDYNPAKLNEYMRQADPANCRYPGINSKYFDGRMSEFLALKKLMTEHPDAATSMARWDHI